MQEACSIAAMKIQIDATLRPQQRPIELQEQHEIIVAVLHELRCACPASRRVRFRPENLQAGQPEKSCLVVDRRVGIRIDVDPNDLTTKDLPQERQSFAKRQMARRYAQRGAVSQDW